MRNLKYIKVFEAFESVKLSRTLGYIESSRDKSVFLDYIKRICNIIDFPYSELSDDIFEYLPFSSALKKADIITDEPCDATSERAYPEYAVAGEVCQEGKVKRKWGRQIRSAACPICNGTGVKPKTGEPKLVKFWFTKDGKYVDVTCVDGIIRISASEGTLSQNTLHYTVSGDEVDRTERAAIRSLQTGQYVRITINRRTMFGSIISDGRSTWVIQPYENGGSPYHVSSSTWRKIARYSWEITGGDFTSLTPMSLNNMDGDKAKEEADPYTWNTGVDFSRYGLRATGRDIEEKVKNAHFAIVLDFGKMKKLEYVKRSTTTSSREDSKSGTLAFRSNDDIKRENIARYIKKLADNLEVDGADVSNLSKVIKKLLGNSRNTTYNLRHGIISSNISTILKIYIDLLSASDDSKERYLNDLNSNIKYIFKENIERNKNVSKNIEDSKRKLKNENKESHLRVLNHVDDLSLAIYNSIIGFELETIEDLEILHQKVLGMKNITKSDRYYLTPLSYYLDYLNRSTYDYAYRYLVDNYYVNVDRIPKIEKGIDMMIRIIKKM